MIFSFLACHVALTFVNYLSSSGLRRRLQRWSYRKLLNYADHLPVLIVSTSRSAILTNTICVGMLVT